MAYIDETYVRARAPRGFIDDVARNNSGIPIPTIIAECIEEASGEVDGFIGGRYTVPLTEPVDRSVKWVTGRLTLLCLAGRLPSDTGEWVIILELASHARSWLVGVRDRKIAIPGLEPSDQSSLSDSNRDVLNVPFADHREEGGDTLDSFVNRNTRQPWQPS